MRILWVSCLAWNFNGEYPYPVNSAGGVSGSLFQQSMIEAVEAQGHQIDIICDYPYSDGNSKHAAERWQHSSDADDEIVSSISTKYVSILYKETEFVRAVKQHMARRHYDVVVGYLIHQPYMKALYTAKKIDSSIKSVLICPDLPDMMDMSLGKKRLKAFLKGLDKKRINKLYDYVDGYVLFSEMMKERIPVGNKPYAVIEGIASLDGLDSTPLQKEKFIMYAGTLHHNVGIQEVIESLNYVSDENLKFYIFGTGELESYLKKISEENPRVVFKGFAERKELFEYEKKALALMNIRNPEDSYTRYSFPSKTFEFLYSGTPFITTRLKGIPSDYDDHLFYVNDMTPEAIAERIDYISNLDYDELNRHADSARHFVEYDKSKSVQGEKFIEFMNGFI